MKTVFIHIRTHKTGTTSIQVFLDRVRHIIAIQGVLSPQAGQPSRNGAVAAGHHVLSWYLLGKRKVTTDESWTALRAEIERWPGDRVVISSEDFSSIDNTHIEDIKNRLSGCDVRAVVYLRNPLALMKSSYKQRVGMGTYSKGFSHFCREHVGELDYGELLGRWITALGEERVHVRFFDKLTKRYDLEADFCKVIGIDFQSVRSFLDGPLNVSPTDRTVIIMRRLNRLLWWTGDTRRRGGWPAVVRAQVRRQGIRGKLVRSIFGIRLVEKIASQEDVDWLRTAISLSHEAFLELYVEPEDRGLLRF